MNKLGPIFLTANQVVRLYRTRIIASMPTQRPLLESAIKSPINQHYYTRTDNIYHLAAVLAQKIMLNHSFSDGNKRTSVAAADMFLRKNGYYLTPGDDGLALGEGGGSESNNSPGTAPQSSLADAHVAVASGQWDEEELARFYKEVVQLLE
jgi:prophage maintenance system killer protein